MTRVELQEIFNDIADKHEMAEDMLHELRGMELSQADYNTIIVEWDNMLNKYYNQKVTL